MRGIIGYVGGREAAPVGLAGVRRVEYCGDAVGSAVRDLHGAFAFGVICSDRPGEILAVRRFSPLVIGVGQGENYIASDMGAVRAETDKVYVIDDDEVCRVTPTGVEITNLD